VRPWVGTYDAFLLDRHGAVTVGQTVFEAYFKMEKVEHTALSIAAARSLGGARTLTPEMLAKLMAVYTGGAEPPVPYPFPGTQG
jgi:L-fuculose-phosphate aldolase